MTWVLLRGLTREARHWGSFPRRLESRLGERVIALDAPGNGTRHRERSPAGVNRIAQACRDDLMRRGIAPPYNLLAMSLGAMVALEWSARWPQEVAGAVLVNTSARGYAPPWKRLRPGSYPALARIAMAGSRARREATVLAMTSNRAGEHEGLVEQWAAIGASAPVSTANALRQLAAAARFMPVRPRGVPLLFLASERDALVSPECSRKLAAAWKAPLAVHPGAGHDLPLDAPDWVADQTVQWLQARLRS